MPTPGGDSPRLDTDRRLPSFHRYALYHLISVSPRLWMLPGAWSETRGAA
jgi:hypothetical protein